jgi:hypothetical protein
MTQVGGRICARCKFFHPNPPGAPIAGECHKDPADIFFVPVGTLPNGQPKLHGQVYRKPAGPGLECGQWQQALEMATHLDLTKLQFPGGGLK